MVVQQLESSQLPNNDTNMPDTYDGMNPPNLAGGVGLRDGTAEWDRPNGITSDWD